ncbi:MAG: SEC-C metal-binding domain-containing protein [Dehalococcoidia bacterium]
MNLLKKILHQPPPEAASLGRNDPCWCGSGKKYKKCHFEADQKYFARKRSEGCTTST